MGREVRMVPKGWQHPEGGHDFKPLLEGSYHEAAREWDEGKARWDASYNDMTYEDYAGFAPSAVVSNGEMQSGVQFMGKAKEG